MAKVSVTFEDVFVDSAPMVSCAMKIEPAGEPSDGPATNSMMVALTVKRLWDNGSLLRLMQLVSADALQQREMLIRRRPRTALDG